MTAMAAILDLVSLDYLTNAWDDWSDFFVAYLFLFNEFIKVSTTCISMHIMAAH
jgi:hypothetical protein